MNEESKNGIRLREPLQNIFVKEIKQMLQITISILVKQLHKTDEMSSRMLK